jgi:hypothetical protein
VSEPSDRDRLDEEALAALLPDSMALRIARRDVPRPRTAEVCATGTTRQIAIILMILEAGAGSGQYEITSRRGPYAADQVTDARVYITLQFPDSGTRTAGPGAGARVG